jgi:hypothetical protein
LENYSLDKPSCAKLHFSFTSTSKQYKLQTTVIKHTEEELKAFRQDRKLYITKSNKQIRILHLSDIHLATGAQAQQYFTQLSLNPYSPLTQKAVY